MRLLLLCAVMTLTGAASALCPRRCAYGWTYFSGRCYLYVRAKMDWGSAENKCLSHYANLASVTSRAEDIFIHYLIKSQYGEGSAWIGGTDSIKDGIWLWSDGKRMSYTNWAKHEPNNRGGKQDCLRANWLSRVQWDDFACSGKLSSICAKSI